VSGTFFDLKRFLIPFSPRLAVGSPAHGKQKAATGDGNRSCKKDWAVVEVLLKKAHEKPNEPVLSVKWLELGPRRP
jgi:hypothetical protein